MSNLQIYLTLAIFGGVILVIAFDLLDMAVATMLGTCLLSLFGILREPDILEVTRSAGGAISLLFGGMVVARVLSKTGLFERLGAAYLRSTGGSGKRFLLLMIMLVAPVCAILPNATTVILLAPIIIQVARALKIDFVGPMVLVAIVSNSAGMLTLVGDPATFLVGSSIGLTFGEYLQKVSLGGLLSLLVLLPLLPWLMPDVWRARCELPANSPTPRIERPFFAAFALADLVLMVLLFIFGEVLPVQVVPPAAAIIAAAAALLIVYCMRVEPIDDVFRAVDWKTLIFLISIFFLVRGFVKTGLLQGMSLTLNTWFGDKTTIVAMMLLFGIALLSSLLANIPVVAASLVMVSGYLVAAQVVPETALTLGLTKYPPSTLPVFIAMMFGATLGGNATLIGASANVVAAGICANHGQPVTFARFMRYGIPLTAVQLVISACYVLVLAWITR